MNNFPSRFVLVCFAGLLSCNSSNIKRNQTPVEASKMVLVDTSDPISFVENWILLNQKDVVLKTVERVLFDGKIYQAVVRIEIQSKERQVVLISFKKVDSKWSFLSQKTVALDFGWPER